MQSVLNPKYFEDCVSSVYVLVKKVSIVSDYFFIFLNGYERISLQLKNCVWKDAVLINLKSNLTILVKIK